MFSELRGPDRIGPDLFRHRNGMDWARLGLVTNTSPMTSVLFPVQSGKFAIEGQILTTRTFENAILFNRCIEYLVYSVKFTCYMNEVLKYIPKYGFSGDYCVPEVVNYA